MVLGTGQISFSEIQTEFGGTNPISFSEYYTNANPSYTNGVSGLPANGNAININAFKGKAKPTGGGLYAFTSHTFTNAGATGRSGPTLQQCRTAYSSTSWTQDTTNNYLNMVTQGIQEWKVPRTGNYKISAYGAAGAGSGNYYGGNGAFIQGTFNLTSGEVICIVAGQMGISGPNSGGGGGGASWVYKKSGPVLLLVAGGGGGGGHDVGFGGGGSSTNTPVSGGGSGNGGYSSIGSGGNGGTYSSGYTNSYWNGAAGGGGGWNGNGGNGVIVASDSTWIGYGGSGRSGNFVGGYHGQNSGSGSAGNGGFGGGGGAGGNGNSGGGGGGYTGGGGGNNWPGTGNPGHGGGQGGGSYNNGSSQTNTANNNTSHGYVSIEISSSSLPAYYTNSSGYMMYYTYNGTTADLKLLSNINSTTVVRTYNGITASWNIVHDKDLDSNIYYGMPESSRILYRYTFTKGGTSISSATITTYTGANTSVLGSCYAPSCMGTAYGAFIIGGYSQGVIHVLEFDSSKNISFTYTVPYTSEVYGTEVIPQQASGFSQHFAVAYTRGSRQLSSYTVDMSTRTWGNRYDISYTAGTTGPSNGLGMIYYPPNKAIFTGDPDVSTNRIAMNDTSTSTLFVYTITQNGNSLNFSWLKTVAMTTPAGGYPYSLSTAAYNAIS